MALDKMRENYQRKLNKKIQNLNKEIEKDNLWKGRFVARQIDARWERFSDNSGGVLHTIIRMADKKDGYYKDFVLEYAPWFKSFKWHINLAMNDFIVKDCKVWDENPNPYKVDVDYTKVLLNETIWKKSANYFISKE